jgi:hypothetical protein
MLMMIDTVFVFLLFCLLFRLSSLLYRLFFCFLYGDPLSSCRADNRQRLWVDVERDERECGSLVYFVVLCVFEGRVCSLTVRKKEGSVLVE